MTLGAFVFIFVLGPLLCALALRLPSRPWALALLGLAVVAAVFGALRLQAGQAELPSLVALWLAWVLAVAMVALAIRRHVDAPRPRRWLSVLALLATTLPWFGLATARIMV